MAQWFSVSFYLLAIVAANFAVAQWGQAALPFTAFILIPFDLVARDVLHEEWRGRNLWPRMAALIATGSVLTAALSWDARSIAVASFVAFGLAGVANALVYHLLDRWHRFAKMNASNAVAAVVDSVVFPVIAFAVVDVSLCAAQAGSKFIGGIVWSACFILLFRRKKNHEQA